MNISSRGLLGLAFVIFILIASTLSARFTSGGSIYGVVYEQDGVGEYLRRMACIKEALPADGKVGFIYGLGGECKSSECGESYYLTEYAIAPVLADIDVSNLEWVILKIDDPTQMQIVLEKYHLETEKSCGDGLFLLHKGP